MGTWNIEISGHGCHHNANPEIDADLATKEFVAKLKAQGHHIDRAQFVLTGQSEDLLKTDNRPPATPVPSDGTPTSGG